MRLRLSFTALLVLAAFLATAPATRSSELSILTYNVHGLPSWVAGDDPPARIPQILAKASGYDVVLLQEDFAHHEVVAAHNPFPHLLRGNAPWSAPFEGAGLTILSRHESVASQREPYGVCSGWIGAANDCLANKGWMLGRVRLPAAELDVWNTHLDAGRGDADRDVRRVQLARLGDAIERHSAGRAVVVGGDLNLEWDDPADRALLEAFARRLGLAAAVRTQPDGWRSHLDYLLVRSGDAICVETLAAGKDERLVNAAGDPLSDHPALYAKLRVGACDAAIAMPDGGVPPSSARRNP